MKWRSNPLLMFDTGKSLRADELTLERHASGVDVLGSSREGESPSRVEDQYPLD
jgi:hypothetical protein